MNHTSEPWYTRQDGEETSLHGVGGAFVADTETRSWKGVGRLDLERAAACVNFCKGIPTSGLNEILSEGKSLLDLMGEVKDWDIGTLRAFLMAEAQNDSQ